MSARTFALLAIVIVAIENSFVGAISKIGLQEIPSPTFAALRFFIASAVLLPFFLKQKSGKLQSLEEIAPISLFAIANIIFFILGVKLTTANFSMTIYAAVPLLTGIILYYFFKEKLAGIKLLGVIVGFIGVFIIALLPLFDRTNPFSGDLLGNFFLMIGVLVWSFYLVFSKRLQERYSPLMITSNFIFVGAIVTMPLLLWDTWTHMGWWNHLTIVGIFSIIYVAIMITILGYLLQQYAIKHGGAVFAGTTFYLTPVLAFCVNYFMLGEQLSIGFVLGAILALAGTYLVMKK